MFNQRCVAQEKRRQMRGQVKRATKKGQKEKRCVIRVSTAFQIDIMRCFAIFLQNFDLEVVFGHKTLFWLERIGRQHKLVNGGAFAISNIIAIIFKFFCI